MIVPKEIENVGTVYPEYKVVVGKKKEGKAGKEIINQLKNKMNTSQKASIETIECIDL